MPKITVLAHEDLCPQGREFQCSPGARLCDQLAANGIPIEQMAWIDDLS